jgi:hypothetical protein
MIFAMTLFPRVIISATYVAEIYPRHFIVLIALIIRLSISLQISIRLPFMIVVRVCLLILMRSTRVPIKRLTECFALLSFETGYTGLVSDQSDPTVNVCDSCTTGMHSQNERIILAQILVKYLEELFLPQWGHMLLFTRSRIYLFSPPRTLSSPLSKTSNCMFADLISK